MIIKEIKANLLYAPQEHIGHGVNCQGVMGSGVAKTLYKKWPRVKEQYLEFCKIYTSHGYSKEALLGEIQAVALYPTFGRNSYIWNMFTQYNYGTGNQKYLLDSALIDCFAALVQKDIKEIAIPKIGCGLAGGNWEEVKELINQVTGRYLDVYVYYL